MHFRYRDKEIDYLKSKDKALAEVIDKISHIEREIDTDLFSSVIHHIIGRLPACTFGQLRAAQYRI